MKSFLVSATLLMLLGLSSCTIISQGEVGIKRRLGKIQAQTLPEGVQDFKMN